MPDDTSTESLPEYARKPWPEPEPVVPISPRPMAPPPDPDGQTIQRIDQGVEALQVLLKEPGGDEPSKMDVAIDLLETISGQMKSLLQGMDLFFYRQNELFRAMGQKIPPPPKQD